jgi:exonuclease VII large subunit
MNADRRELAETPTRRAELLLGDNPDEELDQLEIVERALYRRLERGTMQIAALEARLAEMRFAQIQPRIDFHRDQLRAASEQVEQAVHAAMRANAVAFAAFEAVVQELGRDNANQLMPLVHFAGGLNEPSLEIWRQQLADQHERIARQQGRRQ